MIQEQKARHNSASAAEEFFTIAPKDPFKFTHWHEVIYGTPLHRRLLEGVGLTFEFWDALLKRRRMLEQRMATQTGRKEGEVLAEIGEKVRGWRENAGISGEEAERISEQLTSDRYFASFLEAGMVFPSIDNLPFGVYEGFARRYGAPLQQLEEARSLFEQELASL